MRAGISIWHVRNAMEVAAHQFEHEDPKEKAGLRIKVSPWRETPTREYELTLVFILGAVGLVFLIACADAAGLLLTRAVQRRREIAVRTALGAGFFRVARQLFAEGLLLALLGSLAGVATAR